MTAILELKEKLVRFYGKNEVYLVPVIRFVLALTVFLMINLNIGYMEAVSSIPVALILALLCAILPVRAMMLIATVVILLDMYALSLEVCLVAVISCLRWSIFCISGLRRSTATMCC